jgi:hypothetical protein
MSYLSLPMSIISARGRPGGEWAKSNDLLVNSGIPAPGRSERLVEFVAEIVIAGEG